MAAEDEAKEYCMVPGFRIDKFCDKLDELDKMRTRMHLR